MLEPDQRVVLLDQLRPPPGYRLLAGVATTFTLDLTSALVPPLAFASFEMREATDQIAALEAVRSCADRVDIFCQAGQMLVPRQLSDLMAFLEPMVHPVRGPRPGFLFHPKLWFLHFAADAGGEVAEMVRLVCSTRNLTDSHAWDAAVTLDGTVGGSSLSANRPLATLISHLPRLAVAPLSRERSDRVEALARLASTVQWELPEAVNDISFHAFGIPGLAASPDFSGYDHLIVSPFCNDAGVRYLTAAARGKIRLVSSPSALDQLEPEAPNSADTFILDPLAVLDVPDDRTDTADIDTLSGLHAKVIVVERERRGHAFIGSANATSAAFGGNVEFMVELVGGTSKLGVAAFIDALEPLMLAYQAGTPGEPDALDDAIGDLRRALRLVAEMTFRLVVAELSGDGTYELRLSSEKPIAVPDGYQLRAELLTRPGRSADLGDTELEHRFGGVSLVEITPFVVLYLTDVERSTVAAPLQVSTVVHAQLDGDPIGRLDEVLARQVDSPEKFLRFVALLLGFSDGGGLAEVLASDAAHSEWNAGVGAGLFELLVEALATNRAALHDLGRLVERLQSTDTGRASLPEGFETLWVTVSSALHTMDEAQ